MLGYWKQKEGAELELLLDLLTRMLNPDPSLRLDIDGVINHDWFKGPITEVKKRSA
jgi:hypothetical protein